MRTDGNHERGKNQMNTLVQLPQKKLLEAVELAKANPIDAVRLLCDWWNHASGCAPELRCADIPLLWVSKNDGLTFSAVHSYSPSERADLFTQPTWRSSIAVCGDSLIVVFLRKPSVADLDLQRFFHTYLVNGTEYESLGIDFEDYQPGVFQQFSQLQVRFAHEYRALKDHCLAL